MWLVQLLQRQTEGRVPVFSHEVVPDHLRTKPDPEVEEQEKQLITDAARISPDVAQVGLLHLPLSPRAPDAAKSASFTLLSDSFLLSSVLFCSYISSGDPNWGLVSSTVSQTKGV